MMKISDKYEDCLFSRRRTITVGKIVLPWPFPIAYGILGDASMIFGIPVFGYNTPKFIDFLYRVFRNIDNIKFWFLWRFHPKHQYHIINTGLKPGYYDEDYRILNACMKLLCEYVEYHGEADLERFNKKLRDEDKENGLLPNRQADQQEEALNIYRWWKYEKPEDERKMNSLTHEIFGGECISWEPNEPDSVIHKMNYRFGHEDKSKIKTLEELEKKIADDEQKMLHRLIDIRYSLWT